MITVIITIIVIIIVTKLTSTTRELKQQQRLRKRQLSIALIPGRSIRKMLANISVAEL